MIGVSQAKTYRELTYKLSRGDHVIFILPQAKELENGRIAGEGTIELGPHPKLTIKISVTKSSLFRFNEQVGTYNNYLLRIHSAVDINYLSGYIVGFAAGQEKRRAGYIFRLPQPSQRNDFK